MAFFRTRPTPVTASAPWVDKNTYWELTNVEASRYAGRPLNVLLLADNRHAANVVQDHINAFRLDSRHNVFVVNPIWEQIDQVCDLSRIDVILVHYSILILGDYFLPAHNQNIVRDFTGPKAQIIQDEARWINRMKEKMVDLGVSAVFSSLNVENMIKVYSGAPISGISFYSCLPGYISQYMKRQIVLPIRKRGLDVVYRGRDLPFWFGRQAREKTEIGRQMLSLYERGSKKVDIAVNEDSRIYGNDWTKFIASARATLGVEGGVSIFDFDGQAEARTTAYLKGHPGADFEEVFAAVLHEYEGNVVHRTVTPRIFEAISLKSALVLYPGAYRGVLVPYRHYIPLKRDGSNANQVLKALKDTRSLQEMVDRTYLEIMEQEELQARFYVTKIDAVLDELFHRMAPHNP